MILGLHRNGSFALGSYRSMSGVLKAYTPQATSILCNESGKLATFHEIMEENVCCLKVVFTGAESGLDQRCDISRDDIRQYCNHDLSGFCTAFQHQSPSPAHYVDTSLRSLCTHVGPMLQVGAFHRY